MRLLFLILTAFCTLSVNSFSQLPKSYQFNSGWNSSLPRTNAINDFLIRNDSIWVGTELGLSLTVNGGVNWTNFSGTDSFYNKGISAIAMNDAIIWVATGYSTKLDNQSIQTGGGLHYSTDRGAIWHFIPQPIDHQPSEQVLFDTVLYGSNKIRALAITVPQQNITFDIALTSHAVWIASWAGMLRKSTDLGTTWQRIILPPDNLDDIDTSQILNFDLSPISRSFIINGIAGSLTGNLNHSLFSLYASDDSTIWAGTAGGINKSTDGGWSWQKYSHQNQLHSISGNFVVALKEQKWNGRRIMWAATVNANDPDEIKGVSYSEDGGKNWNTTLLGEWAHNMAVRDSIVYIATDNGLYRSSDFGESWSRSSTIYDTSNLQRFVSTEIYAVAIQGDTVWFGGPEGTAYTLDSPLHPFGTQWHIFRTAEQIHGEHRTYSYPNPFSPDNESTRIHYSLFGYSSNNQSEITVRIFDFSMQPVRTLLQKASRRSGQEYDEIWDGRSDKRTIVANGVYFYRIEIDNQSPLWGKILVVR